MNWIKHMIMEEAPADNVGVLGGQPPAVEEPPVEAPPVEAPPVEAPPSIYGDLTPKFPDGLDPEVQQSTFLKPFVDKETGEVNYSNLMKSYVHAQKNVHSSKAVIPGENATDQELDEFYSKLGYKVDESEYVLEKKEDSSMPDEALNDFKKFARENRLPLSTAQKMADYLDGTMSSVTSQMAESQAQEINSNLEGLKTEWGQAYEPKLEVAKKVLNDIGGDLVEEFKDPRIGSNPAIIKLLNGIGEKLYKEDGIRGDSNNDNMLSPADAQAKINEIMGEKDGPYWNKNHPSHQDTVMKVNKLYQMKTGRK